MTMSAIAAAIVLFASTFLTSVNAEGFTFEGETFPTMGETTPNGIANTACCSDEECISTLGANSICQRGLHPTSPTCFPDGLPGLRKKRGVEGMDEFTPEPADPDLNTLAGTCGCVRGLHLVDGACQQVTECCTNRDCHPTMGTNSFCGPSEHVSTAFCVGETLSWPLRRKREAGFSTSDFRETLLPGGPSATPTSDTGRCFCDEGFEFIVDACVVIETFHGNNDTNIGTTGQPSPNVVHICNLLACESENCTEYIGDETCPRDETSPCYVSKQCLDDGERFYFGCEDRCMVSNETASAPCYTASCETNLCNNHTALLKMFICNSADGRLLFGRKGLLPFVCMVIMYYIPLVTYASK